MANVPVALEPSLAAPARASSLALRIADALTDAIAGGAIEPGDRLVETDITARMGVSRVPFREALKLLEAQGIVEVLPHRGARVVPFDDTTRVLTMPEDRNVLGEKLDTCSIRPISGFFRTGCCETGPEDIGAHVVCAEVTDEFLAFSKSRGNDLSTPVPEIGFPGLQPGDRWCLCAARWKEALDAGVAPRGSPSHA